MDIKNSAPWPGLENTGTLTLPGWGPPQLDPRNSLDRPPLHHMARRNPRGQVCAIPQG